MTDGATIERYPSGAIKREDWQVAGVRHRDGDLPASIGYYEEGSINWQRWFMHGDLHRDYDLPAYIEYQKDGTMMWEQWYQNYKLHRDTGPAYVIYREDGSILSKWHLEDILQQETVSYPEPAFEDLVKPAFSFLENKREPASDRKSDKQESACPFQENTQDISMEE